MSYLFKKQTPKDAFWLDESGTSVPYSRTTQSERLKERLSFSIANKATELHESLKEFKSTVQVLCNDVMDAVRKDHKIKTDSKGNFTWYNFDKSIKVEVNVNGLIRFDEILIDEVKKILMSLIEKNISGESFIKSIVAEAFQTSTGRLDTRRILGLKKHSSRIQNKEIKKEWDKAMELIDKSISSPESKTYFRVWIKNQHGEYQNIDLNFSSINI